MSKQQLNSPFANLIRDKRVAVGMTQDQLAGRVGCQQQTIEKIEAGKTRKSSYLPVIFSILGLDMALLTGERPAPSEATPRKFVRSSAIKFYIQDWRKFMGVSAAAAAKAAGMTEDQYQAHEVYPINFTLEQIFFLAEAIGVRGDQFWFPPPRRATAKTALAAPAKARRR